MSNFTVIRDKIKHLIEQKDIKEFAIFPYGEMGVLTEEIIIKCFNRKTIIFDNELCKYNVRIHKLEDVNKYISDKTVFLFASEKAVIREELINKIPSNRIVDLFEKETNNYVGRKDIGDYSYGPLANPDIRIASVGAFCSFADGCSAVWNHQLNMVTNHDFIYENVICEVINNQKVQHEDLNRKFHIGNDVWIGKNAILTNGITIGNGVRVAAGAVVTKDVPDYAIVAGVPAKIIGYRFNEEQINQLNEIAWWNWPIQKIKESYDDFFNIEVFLKKHYEVHKESTN